MSNNNTSNVSFKNPTQFFNLLNIIFFALLSGSLIFFLITHLMFQKGQNQPFTPEMVQIFNYLVPFLCVIEGGIGIFLFDLRMKKMSSLISLKDKMKLYFQGKIVKWALFESAGLFAVVAYFLTGYQVYSLWFLLIILLFAFNRPTPSNFLKYAQLTKEEKLALDENKDL